MKFVIAATHKKTGEKTHLRQSVDSSKFIWRYGIGIATAAVENLIPREQATEFETTVAFVVFERVCLNHIGKNSWLKDIRLELV